MSRIAAKSDVVPGVSGSWETERDRWPSSRNSRCGRVMCFGSLVPREGGLASTGPAAKVEPNRSSANDARLLPRVLPPATSASPPASTAGWTPVSVASCCCPDIFQRTPSTSVTPGDPITYLIKSRLIRIGRTGCTAVSILASSWRVRRLPRKIRKISVLAVSRPLSRPEGK